MGMSSPNQRSWRELEKSILDAEERHERTLRAVRLLCRTFHYGGQCYQGLKFSDSDLAKRLDDVFYQLASGSPAMEKELEDFILACQGNPPDTK